MKMNYTDITTTDTNHYLTECSYKNINYISIEFSVMLLYNYIYNQGPINGSVGSTEIYILFKNRIYTSRCPTILYHC